LNWKSFVFGLSIGIVSGYGLKEVASQKIPVSPERVLNDAKKLFKKNGPISGSWIQMKAEPYERNELTYQVYKGGISKVAEGKNKQYEFIADAASGTILDVYPFV
jgi:predicted small secreted protein